MNTIDRSRFRKGPWDNEPDFLEWNYLSINCEIKRMNMGFLCGYIYVKNNNHFPISFQNIFNVHGGVTYESYMKEIDIWKIGFDCYHVGDECPLEIYRFYSHYWTFQEVKDEVEKMVEQYLTFYELIK